MVNAIILVPLGVGMMLCCESGLLTTRQVAACLGCQLATIRFTSVSEIFIKG